MKGTAQCALSKEKTEALCALSDLFNDVFLAINGMQPEDMHEANKRLATFTREWNKLMRLHKLHMRELGAPKPSGREA